MKVEFDPAKDVSNRREHGVSLAAAELLDFDTAIYVRDVRYDYGEERTQTTGFIGGRLRMLVVTIRDDVLRAVSLRKANLREAKRYGEET